MKVAIYVPHGSLPDRRGFAPAVVAWNHALNLATWVPLVICAREAYPPKFETVSEIPIYRLHEGRVYRRLFRKITRIDPYPLHRRTAAIVNRVEPDLFHAHQIEFPVKSFYKYLRRRIPIILHAHVTTHVFDPRRGTADRYIAASNFIRDRLVSLKGYPYEKISVIPNGVDTDMFCPPTAEERRNLRKKFNLPEDAVVVGFTGRKQEVKGFHVFLRSARHLLQKYRDLHVIAVGPELEEAKKENSYSQRQEIRQELIKCGRYLEYSAMPQAELSAIYKISNILLLPSLWDTQGMAQLEAMASGCLTVSSNRGGIRESIRHQETGFLLDDPEDIERVNATLEDIIEKHEGLDCVRSQAREHILNNFEWSIVTDRVERIYHELYSGRNL